MSIHQAFNKKIGAWVKFKFTKGKGFVALDIKEKDPLIPFKGVFKKGEGR